MRQFEGIRNARDARFLFMAICQNFDWSKMSRDWAKAAHIASQPE